MSVIRKWLNKLPNYLGRLKGHRTWMVGAVVMLVLVARTAALSGPQFVEALAAWGTILLGFSVGYGASKVADGLRDNYFANPNNGAKSSE